MLAFNRFLSPFWVHLLKSPCCFLFLVLYCLGTCVNRVANWVKQKFTPLRFEFYKLFFWGHFMENFGNLSQHYQNSFFFLNLNFFSVLGSLVSKNICKLHHKLKNLPELSWSWQNKPWYNKDGYFIDALNCVLFISLQNMFCSSTNGEAWHKTARSQN